MSHEYAVMPKSDYTAACNAIRTKRGTSGAIKSGDMAANILAISGEETVYGEILNEEWGGGTRYNVTGSITHGTMTGGTIAAGGTATFTIVPSSGYTYPAQANITVTNATMTAYSSSTGAVTIGSATGNVTITATCPAVTPATYTITYVLTHITGDSENPTSIAAGGTATAEISADSGYELPPDITVTGAAYTYDEETGEISIYSPTGNVTITADGEPVTPSTYSFYLNESGYITEWEYPTYNMTWGQFISTTTYPGFSLDTFGNVLYQGRAVYYYDQSTYETPQGTDAIVDGRTYYVSINGGGGSN